MALVVILIFVYKSPLLFINLSRYCEERPLMLSNAGMGANLCTYYQKSSPEDQHGNLLRNQSDTLGSVIILEHGNKSPFLGEVHGGCSQSSVETNMYKAPVFPHRLQSTDYLLVRSAKGKLSLRRINKIVAVGQQVCVLQDFSLRISVQRKYYCLYIQY